MNLGERIKQIRLAKNIQSNELADKIGITNVYLSYIEHGTKTPKFSTLHKICNALDVTLSEFFTIEETDIPFEYQELLQNAKTLSPKQLASLNEFLKALKEKNDNEQ